MRSHEITKHAETIKCGLSDYRRVYIRQPLNSSVSINVVALTMTLFFLAVSLGLIVLRLLGSKNHQSACQEPRLRREWRSLTMDEKHDFMQAVLCLSNKPSTWGPNGTIYDDFALLHGEIGSWSTKFACISDLSSC